MSEPKLPLDLQPRETVVLFCRRHVVFLVMQLAKLVLAALVPAIATVVLMATLGGFGGTGGLIVLAIVAAWCLYWAVRIYFAWYRYDHDIWVVTNQRLIDSRKNNWFHHQMASADLVDVEDISVHRSGLLQTLFDFGDVRCQTAGEVPNFILSGIPRPAKVLGIVDAHRDAARRELGRAAD